MGDSPAVPKPSGVVNVVAGFIIPLIAGIGGLVVGDLGVYGLVQEPLSQVEGKMPFSNRLDYAAFVAAVPYFIVLAILRLVMAKIPDMGMWKTVIVRTVTWYLLGVIARVVLAGFIPSRVPPSGMLQMPAVLR